MNLNLTDKVYIVSGSSRGIGQGIAKALLEEGARVVLTGRDQSALTAATRELTLSYPDKVLSQAGDLRSTEVLTSLENIVMSTWSRMDGLIANAGGVRPLQNPIPTDEDWIWYHEANFEPARRFIDYFSPRITCPGGSVVIISSIAGLEDIGAPAPYSASKAALEVYAKSLSRKLGPRGLRVNTIAPGNILFPQGNWDRKHRADPEGVQAMLHRTVPLQRFGSPEDIGSMACFLMSDKASFITGACFVIDGGQTTSFS